MKLKKIRSEEVPTQQQEMIQKNVEEYAAQNGKDINYSSYFLHTGEAPDLHDSALAHVNIVWDPNRRDNKYVFLHSIKEFGAFHIISLVGLDKGLHREITKDYLNQVLTSEIFNHEGLNSYLKSNFLIAGGFSENMGDFYGGSGDFTNFYGPFDVNAVSSNLVRILNDEQSGFEDDYLNSVMQLSAKHKGSASYYERLFDLFLNFDKENKFNNYIQPLFKMKSRDRAILEEKDITQVEIQEMVEGICRYALVSTVARNQK